MSFDAITIAKAIELPDKVMYGIAEVTYAVFGQAADAFAQLIDELPPMTYLNDFALSTRDDHAKHLPLMKLSYVFFALLMYAVGLLALYPIGKLLGKRKYRLLGLVHNGFLFLLSVYMCSGIAVTAVACGYRLWNNPVGYGELDWALAKLHWVFYISKIPEFGDTFLMMLKQNYRQISFLHLYHHSSVFIFWFFVVSVGPGGEAYWSAMLNSGVHVVMYGYYAGTLLFVDGPIRNFLNRFKFVITKGQMTQFLLNCVQSMYDLVWLPRSELLYPAGLIGTYFAYMLSLLVLFANFLVKNSGSPRSSPVSPKGPAERKKMQ